MLRKKSVNLSESEVYPSGMSADGFKMLTTGRMVSRKGRSVFKPARYTPEELLDMLKDMEARGCRADRLTGCDCFSSVRP